MKSHFAFAASALASTLLLFACTTTTTSTKGPGGTTSGSSGTGSVSGSEDGVTVSATNAIGVFGTVTETLDEGNTSTTTTSYTASVAILSRTDLTCDVFASAYQSGAGETEVASTTSLSFAVASASALTAGTFAVVPAGVTSSAPSIDATYAQTDATCKTISSEVATAGSVSFTELDGAALVGTFDLTFPSGAHLTGTFDSPPCPIDINLGDPTTGDEDAGTPTVTCE